MTTDVEQLKALARQVSLFNRLTELLWIKEGKRDFWSITKLAGINLNVCTDAPGVENPICFQERDKGKFLTVEEAWEHPVTQKAWSDELVAVGRELILIEAHYSKLSFYLKNICELLNVNPVYTSSISSDNCQIMLETILNKYGKSLNE